MVYTLEPGKERGSLDASAFARSLRVALNSHKYRRGISASSASKEPRMSEPKVIWGAIWVRRAKLPRKINANAAFSTLRYFERSVEATKNRRPTSIQRPPRKRIWLSWTRNAE
jgi:hypothetical protein